METKQLSEPKKLTTQVRGENLIVYLVSWIQFLQAQAHCNDTVYTLNVSQLSELSGVTRKSIKKQMHNVLFRLGDDAPKNQLKRDGTKLVSQLRRQIVRAQNEVSEKEKLVAVYQEHLLNIYQALATHPSCWEAHALLTACQTNFESKNEQCQLCGSVMLPTE